MVDFNVNLDEVGEYNLIQPALNIDYNFMVENPGDYNFSLHKIVQLPIINVYSSHNIITEGDSITYTFTRSITQGDLAVDFMISGSATKDIDYTVWGAVSFNNNIGTIQFIDGNSTVSITLQSIKDLFVENNETTIIEILPSELYTLGTSSIISYLKESILSDTFMHGVLPEDGLKADTLNFKYTVSPRIPDDIVEGIMQIPDGRRISGNVTITLRSAEIQKIPDIVWRLLVDGIPQSSTTIDTTQWLDGTHVLSVQIIDNKGISIRGSSRVVIINNSTIPFTNLNSQAIVNRNCQNPYPTLAWGRVQIKPTKSYSLDPQLNKHPIAMNDADRHKLSTDKIWWVEGLNHVGTPLWRCVPMIMQNKYGDYFIKHFNPQGSGSGSRAVYALPYVERGPAFDGPRGIGYLSPYTVLSADKHKILNSGQTGWIGVDKSGRVTRIDITGEITTILGPRSVTGIPGIDPEETTITLDNLLDKGIKEYIGDANGKRLHMPQDIWVCDSFPFEGVIADTKNNRIVEILLDKKKPEDPEFKSKLMRSWTIPEVSSVWGSYELQQTSLFPKERIAWVAVNPQGLWKQIVRTDDNDKPVEHLPPVKIADIPNAFWVRVHGLRIFVLTLDLGIYEVNPSTNEIIERKPRQVNSNGTVYDAAFCFMNFDHLGSIGPTGRLYYSWVFSKTAVYWIDINTWETGYIKQASILNKLSYGSFMAQNDALGHYSWGFAPHATLPKFIACGISSSSWFLWSACLGELPVKDPAIPYDGILQFHDDVVDKYIPVSACWGYHGHGCLGYSCDDFRDYKTWTEAKTPILEALQPFSYPGQTDIEKEKIAKIIFMQRTRLRF